MMKQVLPPNIIPFKPTTFNPHASVDQGRFHKLAMALMNPDSPIKKELDKYVESLGGKNDPRLWAAYLRSYGRIVTFSNGYLEEMAAIDEIFNKPGVYVDNGAGAGNMAAFMVLDRPERTVVATDYEPSSVDIATARLNFFANEDKTRYQTKVLDLTRAHLPKDFADGGYTHNVAYLLGNKRQVAVNNMVFPLKMGAPFIYIDVADKPKPLKTKALMDIASSAIANGSPANEFDFALVGYINIYVLLSEDQPQGDRLLSDEEQRQLLTRAGLKIHGVFDSYSGASRMYYTTKEGPPQEAR